ncbi:MAG: LysE family translocator [Pseudomonadota bacterium]
MDIATIGAFAAASVMMLMIPGPTALLIVSYALSQGRRVAVATASGVALGDFVAMTCSLAGLGALLMTSADLFVALKLIGAAYLVWMGITMWRGASRSAGDDAQDAPPGPAVDTVLVAPGKVFRDAFVVTALNPKGIVFFVAFVPQFIDPAERYLPQAAILTAVFVSLALVNALGYALLADRLGARLRRPRARRLMARAGGTALMAMAGVTAAARQG